MGGSALRRHRTLLFGALVFSCMFLFFYMAHPFVPFDGDDWKDLGGMRVIALPKWGDWNPSKVMPETMMSLVGYFGAYVCAPLVGDYLRGISLAVALVLSLSIAVYIVLAKDVLERRLGLSFSLSAGVALIFLLFHFLVFKNEYTGNLYLFATQNIDCLFHYILAFLLNASLVLWLISRQVPGNYPFSADKWRGGVFIFALYLAIFSNILVSIVLLCYVAFCALAGLREEGGLTPREIWSYARGHRLYLGVTLAWLVSLVFEAGGGRAHSVGSPDAATFFASLGKVVRDFSQLFLSGEKGILIVLVAFVLFALPALFLALRQKGAARETAAYLSLMKFGAFSLVLWMAYEFLVCAKAHGGYITRIDVLPGFFFFLFLLLTVSLGYLLRAKPNLALIFPILFFVVFCRTVDPEKGYAPSTYAHLPEATCYAVTQDIIAQFQAADAAGVAEFALHVPYSKQDGNWPFFAAFAPRVEQQLFAHGVISRHMKVTIEIDEALNETYHLQSIE